MSTQTILNSAGLTSLTIDISLVQNAGATSPGNPILALAFNTASLVAWYRNTPTGTLTQITLATQTVGGAYSSGGFVEISSGNAPGQYRFDVPDAVIALPGLGAVTFSGAASLAAHTVYFENLATGLTRRATAQAAAATTITLDAAASFADNEIVGSSILITGATTGKGQARTVRSYVASTKIAAVDAWTTTPTGTITFDIFGTAPSAIGSPPLVNVAQINSVPVIGAGVGGNLWRAT